MGVIFNYKAGLLREADEDKSASAGGDKKSMAVGIVIAVAGGLLATGFNVAFTLGGGPIGKAVVAAGNPAWMVSLGVMLVVFLSGGVVMGSYFSLADHYEECVGTHLRRLTSLECCADFYHGIFPLCSLSWLRLWR